MTIEPDGAQDGVQLVTAGWRDGRAEVRALLIGEIVHRDRVDPGSAASRKRFLRGLRECIPGLDDEAAAVVANELTRLEPPPRAKEHDALTVDGLKDARDAAAHAALDCMEQEAVQKAEQQLQSPKLLSWISATLDEIGVVGEETLRTTLYLVGTSRLLRKPLAAVVQGESSSGKSYLAEAVGRCFPDEQILRATDITPQALYYTEEDQLVHRFVVAGERSLQDEGELAQARRALREMLSSGVLRKLVTESDGEAGHRTRLIERHGPIAYVETTTKTGLFDEDANRCLLLSTDESPEQTRRVVIARGKRAQGANSDQAVGFHIQIHHALQRMLFRVKVRIPFAAALAESVPTGRAQGRRAFEHTLGLVQALALLFQRQRRCVTGVLQHGAEIEATLDDFAGARELLMAPLGRALADDLSGAVQRFGEWWWTTIGPSRAVTVTDLLNENTQLSSKPKIRQYVGALRNAGVVTSNNEPNEHAHRITASPEARGAPWLPTVEDLRFAGTPDAERATPSESTADSGSQSVPDVSGRIGTPIQILQTSPKRPDASRSVRDGGRAEVTPRDAQEAKPGQGVPVMPAGPPEDDQEDRAAHEGLLRLEVTCSMDARACDQTADYEDVERAAIREAEGLFGDPSESPGCDVHGAPS